MGNKETCWECTGSGWMAGGVPCKICMGTGSVPAPKKRGPARRNLPTGVDPTQLKECKTCGIPKFVTEFRFSLGKKGQVFFNGHCRTCCNEKYYKAHVSRNAAVRMEYQAEYHRDYRKGLRRNANTKNKPRNEP